MATTPTIPQPQSYNQILGAELSQFASATGIPSVSVGSASLSLMETMALAVSRASGDVFQTLLNSSLQYATGSSLQAIAAEFGITPTVSAVATGFISVTDTSFQKVSTSVYPGAAAVNVGSVVVFAGSDTGFPLTGSIYIGRGTNNSEGPLPYTSIVPIGNYFQFNLSSPTQKFHNFNESIILSQGGNRTIPVNTIVVAPSNGLQSPTQFSTTQLATILDGEVTVTNIPVTALLPGSSGNVPSSAISQFASSPFPNATVSNPVATSGGTDPETDDQLRTQIQNVLTSIGLGTATAIENSLIGASATDEAATIASDNLVNNLDGSSTVYIDTGGSVPYEAKIAGVAIEHIVDSAIGGEKFFQLATGGSQAPVAKAFLQSSNASPFNIFGGYVLAVTVGGVTTQHEFQTSDFQAPGAATAYEICASINADTLVNFEATTSGGGAYVVIRSIAESHESIQVTVPDSPSLVNANNFLGFPTTLQETLRLYLDGTLLSEDGNTASVFSAQQGNWSNTIANGDTLIISVDGTAQITYTILNSDFIATGLANTVSSTNSLQSWAEVFNNKITGITATVSGSQLEITSNLGASDRAQVVINASSTLVIKGMFTTSEGLTSVGLASQYTLDRNTAQFELVKPLAEGDTLTAGTQNTKGTVTSAIISGGSIDFPSEGYIWIAIDEPVTIIPTGVTSGSFLTVTKSGSLISYTSNTANAFSNVTEGDYVIIWSEELNAANRLEGRVHSITTTTTADDTLNILVTSAEAAAVVPQADVVFKAGFVVADMNYAPQKFNLPVGIQSLDAVALFLQAQTDSLVFGVTIEEFLTIGTTTINTLGSVTVVTFDDVGQLLSFTAGQNAQSSYPIIAFEDTVSNYLPSFFHSTVSADTYAEPPDSFVSSFDSTISLAGRDPDEIVTFLNPYGSTLEVTEGVVTNTSNIVTGIPSTTGFRVNMSVSGAGIPGGAIIQSVDSSSQIHISLNATASSYTFTVTSANATAGAVYTNNTQSFTVVDTIVAGTTLVTTGTGAPLAAGTLSLSSGTGDATITFSAVTTETPITIIGVIDDEQPAGEVVQETTVASNVVGITQDPDVRRIRVNDRFFLSSPLSFGNKDTLVAIIDNNPVNNTFQIPLYRTALTNTTYPVNTNDFNATDKDFGGPFSSMYDFGANFSFNNYEVLMQAKKTLSSSTPQSSILYRAAAWGSTGEEIIVSYVYPATYTFTVTPANATAGAIYSNNGQDFTVTTTINPYTFTVTPANADAGAVYSNNGQNFTVAFAIAGGTTLKMSAGTGAPTVSGTLTLVSGTGDATITFTSYTAGTSLVTTGIGSPLASGTLALVSGTGDSSITYSAFTSSAGSAPALNNSVTITNTININITIPTATTATALAAYVNANLAPYISATVVDDGGGGTPGSGIITGSGSAQLLDGQNWLLSSNLSGSPQFVLKEPLALPMDTGYAFNNGETILFTPTTIDQVYKFINTLSVSGISTASLINTANRDSQLEISSDTFGSSGYVQIVGGSGNGYSFPVINSALNIDNTYVAISASAISSSSVLSDQWFFLQAANAQQKQIEIGSNTDVTITPNTPSVGFSTVSLANRTLTQRYFGVPRVISGLSGLKFRVESQGELVCFSYVGSTSSPQFLTFPVDFTDTTGDTASVTLVAGTNDAQYTIISGTTTFSNIPIGNLVTVNIPSSPENSGTFMVTGSSASILQVTNINAVPVATFTITSGVTFTASTGVMEGDSVVIGAPFSSPNQGTYRVIRTFNDSFWIVNPDVIEEEQTLTGSSFTFYEYEATLPGDNLVLVGTAFGATNAGTYQIHTVPSQTSIVVVGALTSLVSLNLNGLTSSFFVNEGTPYTGYKHTYLVTQQPGAPSLNEILFDTYLQYEKINQAAGVEVTALDKLNFPVITSQGLDGYKYNTGLIQEANKIVYGDPTDPLTFPGVAAAGSDVFIREPLALVVDVSIDVRLQTGAPFSSVSQQIQSNVAALINSNKVGQSIALGAIVSVCMAIPGILSVAISTPLYSPTDDLIAVQPSEKTFVLDPSNISVSLIT